MKSKRLCMLLSCLLLFSGACGKTPDVTESVTETIGTETETEPLDPARVLALPDKDWGGRTFRVLGYECGYTQFRTFEISAEGENGEVVNDAIFRRNTAIEDKYNVTISECRDDSTSGDWYVATYPHFQSVMLAGEDLYDLAFLTVAKVGTAARNHMLYDLNTVDHIDFTKAWWNKNVNDTFTILDKLYFTSSDFSLRDKNRTYILVFNKDMAKDLSLGDPFSIVRDGAWTLDLMTNWSVQAARDLDGNGKIDYLDAFGLACDSANAFTAMTFAGDVQVLGKDADGKPQLALNNEHTVDVLDKILKLYGMKELTLLCEDWNGKCGDLDMWSLSSKAFREGRALFVTCFPHSLSGYSEGCKDDYGILPFPKYDEAQERYYTYADPMGMLFGIPATCQTPDFAGFMLEALSAASTDTSLQAYYEVSCKMKYTYDAESAQMLDLIFASIQYDPAKIYNIKGAADFIVGMGYSKKNTFASTYAKMESKALADIEKLIEDYTVE